MFSPCPVNIEAQTPEQVKFARRYNLAFWCIYGVLAVAVVLLAFPDIEKMILGPILVLIFFLAFNAIAHSIRVKGRSGRKELAPISSFARIISEEPERLEEIFLPAYLGTTDPGELEAYTRRLFPFYAAKVPYVFDMAYHTSLPAEALQKIGQLLHQ